MKSRFSHRIIRVAAPGDLETFKTLAKTILTASIILHEGASDEVKEWTSAWNASIEVRLCLSCPNVMV